MADRRGLIPDAAKKRKAWEIRKRRLTEGLRITAPGRRPRPPWELVDWSRTRAYPSWGGGEEVVLINLAGREPEGIVQPGPDYEGLCDEICAKLEKLQDPDLGAPFIPKAHKRADLWHGPQLDRAPDIQFEVDDVAYHIEADLFATELLHEPLDKVPGMHRMDGILVATGPGIPAGASVERNELIDVAPTACHLLGVPVPEDMDGKVMTNLFTEQFNADHPVELGPPTLDCDHGGKEDFDDAEAGAVAETLRAMGYVS